MFREIRPNELCITKKTATKNKFSCSGTRKAKTETFVVRTKKREDVIKRAVDIGGVEMVIEEKTKKEEKVPVVQEKTVAPQVHSMTPAAKNSNKSDLSCSILVDCPTQLICTWIFMCSMTKLKEHSREIC